MRAFFFAAVLSACFSMCGCMGKDGAGRAVPEPDNTPEGVLIWAVDALEKALPDAEPAADGTRLVSVSAARGEMAAGQIAIKSEKPVQRLAISVEAPAGILVKANFVGYVPVEGKPWMTPPEEMVADTIEGMKEIPDPLLPQSEISLAAGRAQPIWIRFYPPHEAEPGICEARLNLDIDGVVVPVSLELKVYAAAVPAERSYKYFHLQNITCQFHQIPKRTGNEYQAQYSSPVFDAPLGFEGWKEEHWSLVREFIRHQVAHRQNGFSVGFWDVIKIIGKGEGEYDFDFTWLEMYVDLILEEEPNAWFMGTWYGWPMVRREAEEDWDWRKRSEGGTDLGTFWPTWVYKRYSYDGKSGIDAELDRAIPAFTWVLDPKIKEITDRMLPALQAFLERKGLAGRYYLCVNDEVGPPGEKSYVEVAKYIKEKAPSVKIMDALRTHGLEGGIDAWAPFAQHFEMRPEFYYERRDKHGEELMWYYCVVPAGYAVNRFFVTPLIKTRMADWIAFKYDFTGFLHWAYMINYPTPTEAEKPYTAASGGDFFAVYRGPDNRPLDSIRYEAILDGIEDYELLRVLEKRDKALAAALCAFVVKDSMRFTRNIEEFRAAREALLELCSMPESELQTRGQALVNGLKRIEPMRPLEAAESTAIEGPEWRLVFEDNFDDPSTLERNWERAAPMRNPAEDWRVENGRLTLPEGRRGDAILLCKRSAPGSVRLEYDCSAAWPPCDLSAMLGMPGAEQIPQGANRDWSMGYFLGFGCENNGFSKLARLGVEMRWYAPQIEPGKPHSVACERDGNRVRHYIDGELAMEYLDPEPLTGEKHDRVGFYIYTHGSIDNVKIYAK